jgi:excisionase family DNA binding protein
MRSILVARCAAVLAALSASGLAPADQQPIQNHQVAVPEHLLTVSEVGEILGFARGYTYELVRRGDIRAVHRGRYWRVTPAAIEEFIANNEGSRAVDK